MLSGASISGGLFNSLDGATIKNLNIVEGEEPNNLKRAHCLYQWAKDRTLTVEEEDIFVGQLGKSYRALQHYVDWKPDGMYASVSGTDEEFRACVAGGISKINIFTHNNLAAARAAREHYTEQTGAFELMPCITEAVKRETMHHIRVFGSDGKA